jgi:hypothetical protein
MTRIPVYASTAQRIAVCELMLDLTTQRHAPHVDALAPNQHDGTNAFVTCEKRTFLVDANGVITDLQTGATNP